MVSITSIKYYPVLKFLGIVVKPGNSQVSYELTGIKWPKKLYYVSNSRYKYVFAIKAYMLIVNLILDVRNYRIIDTLSHLRCKAIMVNGVSLFSGYNR